MEAFVQGANDGGFAHLSAGDQVGRDIGWHVVS
jgi:hypothetical protein